MSGPAWVVRGPPSATASSSAAASGTADETYDADSWSGLSDVERRSDESPAVARRPQLQSQPQQPGPTQAGVPTALTTASSWRAAQSVTSLRRSLEAARLQSDSLQHTVDSLHTANAQLKADHKSVEVRLAKLASDNQTLRSELANTKAKLAAAPGADHDPYALTAELQRLRQSHAQLEEQLRRTADAADHGTRAVAAAAAAASEATLASLQGSLADTLGEKLQLYTDLGQCRNELSSALQSEHASRQAAMYLRRLFGRKLLIQVWKKQESRLLRASLRKWQLRCFDFRLQDNDAQTTMWVERLAERVFPHVSANPLRRCFREWAFLALSSRRSRLATNRAVQKLRQRRQRHYFRLWVDHAHTRRRARQVILRLLHSKVHAAWRAWTEHCRLAAAHEAQQRHADQVAYMHGLEEQLGEWRERHALWKHRRVSRIESDCNRVLRQAWAQWIERIHRQRRVLRIADSRFALQQRLFKQQVFTAWRRAVGTRKHLLRKQTMLTRWRQVGMLHKVFSAWKQEIADQVRRRRVLLSSIATLRRHQLRGGWHRWVAHHHQGTIEELERRHSHKLALALCFSSWQQQVAEERHEAAMTRIQSLVLKKMDNMVLKQMNAGVATCFKAWKAWAADRHQRHRVMQKYLDAMRSRQRHMWFARWRVFVQHRRHQKATALKMLRRWDNKPLCLAFRQWMLFTKSSITAAAADAAVAHEQRVQSIIESARLKLLNVGRARAEQLGVAHDQHLLRLCWSVWAQQWRAGRDARRASAIILRHQRQRMVRLVFHSWTTFARTAVRLRHAERVFGARRLRRIMMTSFGEWRTFSTHRRAARKQVLARLVSAENRKMAAAFTCWQTTTARFRDACSTCDQLVQRKQRQALLKCFQALVAYVPQSRLEKAQEDMKARTLARAGKLLRVLFGDTRSRCFQAWREYTAESLRHKALLRKYAARMRLLAASSCLQSWQAFVTRRKRARYFARKIIGKLEHRSMAAGFNQWRGACVQIRDELETEMQAEMAMAAAMRQATSLAKLRSRLCMQRAFHAWTSLHAQRHQISRMIGWTQSHQNKRLLSKVLTAWKTFAADRSRLKGAAKRVVTRLLSSAKVRTFQAWVQFTRHCKAVRKCFTALERSVQHRQLRHAFDSLNDARQELPHRVVAARLRDTISPFSTSILQYAFGWCVSETALVRVVFNAWSSMSNRSRCIGAACTILERLIVTRSYRRAVLKWRAHVYGQHRCAATVQKLLLRARLKLLRWGLSSWMVGSARRGGIEDAVVRTTDVKARRLGLLMCFHRWHRAADPSYVASWQLLARRAELQRSERRVVVSKLHQYALRTRTKKQAQTAEFVAALVALVEANDQYFRVTTVRDVFSVVYAACQALFTEAAYVLYVVDVKRQVMWTLQSDGHSKHHVNLGMGWIGKLFGPQMVTHLTSQDACGAEGYHTSVDWAVASASRSGSGPVHAASFMGRCAKAKPIAALQIASSTLISPAHVLVGRILCDMTSNTLDRMSRLVSEKVTSARVQSTLRQAYSKLDTTVHSLVEQQHEAAQTLAMVAADNHVLRQQLDVSVREQPSSQYVSELESMAAQLPALRTQAESMQQQLVSKSSELQKATELVRYLKLQQAHNAQLRHDNAMLQTDSASLTNELSRTKTDCEFLAGTVREMLAHGASIGHTRKEEALRIMQKATST